MLLRTSVLLAVAALLLFYTDTALWIPCLLFALFVFAVDVLHIDKSDASQGDLVEQFPPHEFGVLDDYDIDSTRMYGLFVSLCGKSIFIDIKQDRQIEKRKAFARFLFDNADQLDESLGRFIDAHAEFSSRHVVYIGLHSKVLDQGEVFWEPEGYTTLQGLEFSK